MYLKELRINGFKSFADVVRLHLQPGMTAIVGPNGCGKSNIVDAIRWVLGEQSSKSLRAGSMQDVIFQGTTSRKPLNLSEVFLLFTDCEEQLGTAFKEVEVGRRVTRDGGSDYYINGKRARLKDIQRLFLDTGVGQVSYSFMLQGQIDQILSTNPSERRTIFEEAAGISRYKAQRREALNKLNSVEANLARVTDVIEEVSRQIVALKRQAAKALRYKRIKHRLDRLSLAAGAHRWRTLRDEISGHERGAELLREQVERLRANLEERARNRQEKVDRRDELQQSLQEAQQRVYHLRSEKDNAESQVEFAGVRVKDLRDRITAIGEELKGLDAQQKDLAERVQGEAQNKARQQELFGDSDEAFKERSKVLSDVQQRLGKADSDLQKRRQSLLMTESSVSRLRSNATRLEVDLKTFQSRHGTLVEEIQQLQAEHERLSNERAELVHAQETKTKARQHEEAALAEAQQTRQKATEQYRELQGKIRDADREAATIGARVSALRDLQAKFEGFSDGAKAILQGKLSEIASKDEVHVLARQLETPEEYTVALETLLGPAIDTICVSAPEVATELIEALNEKRLGRASLQVTIGEEAMQRSADAPDWLRYAPDVVGSSDEEVVVHVRSFLSGSYFCESLGQFMEFWKTHPKFPFEFVATQNGELIDRRGVIFGGSQKSQKSSTLARENELRRLATEQEKADKTLKDLRDSAQHAQKRIDGAEEAVENQRRRVNEAASELSELQGQLRSAENSLQQATKRIEGRKNDLQSLDKSKADSEERLKKAQAELSEVEGRIESEREAIQKAEAEVTKLREEREQCRESFDEVRLDIAEKKQRLEMLERGLKDLESQRKENERLKARRAQEVDSLHEQISELNEKAETERKKADEIEKTLKVTLEALEKDRVALQAVEKEIRLSEESDKGERAQFEEKQKDLNKLDVLLARKQSEIEHVTEEVQREHEVEIARVDWKIQIWRAGESLPDRMKVDIEDESPEEDYEPERGDPTAEDLRRMEQTDWEEIREEVDSLRGRISSMGPVNLMAIEEYKELKERYEFLKTQSDDLWASKEQLVKAIDDINETSQQLFQETFATVRKNFKYTFETLFGGGEADLELVEAEDILESGIDIQARPPGTRLKTLQLLSGGQKTMTAVALLFAIYMVKPSPFCVLDEIDAPLDDANIGRFCDMLKRFLEYSQFLIITHNKRTISAADTIFGVTMQERGVSRLLSMRFNKSAQKPEAVVES